MTRTAMEKQTIREKIEIVIRNGRNAPACIGDALNKKIGRSVNKMIISNISPILDEFYILVILAQLLIGGIEQNPGPGNELNCMLFDTTNKSKSSVTEKNEVIITTLLQEIDMKTLEIAELKRKLRMQERDHDNLEDKLKEMKMEVDKQKDDPHHILEPSSSNSESTPDLGISSPFLTNRKREYSHGDSRSSSPICDSGQNAVVATSSSVNEKRRRDEFYDQSVPGQRRFNC